MTSRPWFIFKGDYHLGPFTTLEIAQKLKKGELSPEELLWREGENNWKKVKSFEEFFPKPKSVSLPPLPPMPQVEEEEDELPPLPPIEFEEEQEVVPVVDFEEAVPEFYEEVVAPKIEEQAIASKDELEAFFIKEKEKVKKKSAPEPMKKKVRLRPVFSFKLSLILFVGLLCLSGVAAYLGYKTFSERPDHYDGLSRGQVERLERFSSKAVPAGKMEVSFDLTESQSALWVTINPPITTQATLSLTAISGEVFAGNNEIYQGEVLALSEAKIKKGRGKFEVFRIVKGERLLEGRYALNLALMNGPSVDIKSNWTEILKWSGETGLTQVKTNFLWGRLSQDDFTKKLERAKSASTEKLAFKINDRLEKYKTLKELTSNLLALYKTTVESITRAQDIQKFEAEYAKKIGPLLQGIIIESIKTSNDLRAEDAKASELYEKLSEHGKMIGEMASDMVTMTKASKNFATVGKARLLSLFESRVEELNERSGRAIEHLEQNP